MNKLIKYYLLSIIKILIKFILFLLTYHYIAYASLQEYEISIDYDDELFVINNKKFEAITYCFNWEKGDKVIFLKGSPYDYCTTAVLYNIRLEETCELWCE